MVSQRGGDVASAIGTTLLRSHHCFFFFLNSRCSSILVNLLPHPPTVVYQHGSAEKFFFSPLKVLSLHFTVTSSTFSSRCFLHDTGLTVWHKLEAMRSLVTQQKSEVSSTTHTQEVFTWITPCSGGLKYLPWAEVKCLGFRSKATQQRHFSALSCEQITKTCIY